MMTNEPSSIKSIARIAGIWYLLLVITAVYGVLYVPSELVVKGNISATVSNIINNEFYFRTGIICAVLSPVIMVLVALSLYRLLKKVNEHQARIMVVLITMGSIIAFFIESFKITGLMFAKDKIVSDLATLNGEKIIDLLFRLHDYSGLQLGLFWGLWLFPLAKLIFNSEFIPRIFGVLIFLAGIGYVIDALAFILFPSFVSTLSKLTRFLHPMEIPFILWLLIKGEKNNMAVSGPVVNIN